MADLTTLVDGFRQASSEEPGWLSKSREESLSRFNAHGMPTRRTESWKYTRLGALAKMGFTAAEDDGATPVDLSSLPVAPVDGLRVVIVNGRFRADLSDLDGLPSGLGITPLADALRAGNELARAAAEDGALVDGHPFAALNGAFLTDGVLIEIAARAEIERLIHVVIASTGDAAYMPRIVIAAGEGSRASVVESRVGEGAYLSNLAAQVRIGSGAHLGHYVLQAESSDAFGIAMTRTVLGEKASYDNFALSWGGKLARNEIRGVLDGPRGDYRVNGAYIAADEQHLDTTTFIDHAVPDCESREVYKGVLDGASRGVFQGKILVRPDAQRTDGYQMNRAMLLSSSAEIDSKPELEIYADDVKCSHGATVGELEEEQLFYFLARGIDRGRARALLVEAYLADAIDEIQNTHVREVFSGLAAGRLRALLTEA